MRLTTFLIVVLFSLTLQAEEIFAVKEGKNRFSYYIQDAEDPGLYYKSGVKTPRMALRPTPFIKIAFAPGTDPDAVTTPYALRRFRSYPDFNLYEAPSPTEAVAIASRIWEAPGVRFAVPVFERRKELK
jgi:hypothetical protein